MFKMFDRLHIAPFCREFGFGKATSICGGLVAHIFPNLCRLVSRDGIQVKWNFLVCGKYEHMLIISDDEQALSLRSQTQQGIRGGVLVSKDI